MMKRRVRAEAAGVKVFMNRCPKRKYGKQSGEWAWVGGNSGILSSRRQSMHESGKMQSLGLAVYPPSDRSPLKHRRVA